MRLSKMNMEEWAGVAAYIDTLLIPVYSMNIKDKQIEWASARIVEQVSSELERRLAGRVLLLPPIPFLGDNREVLFSFLGDMLKQLGHSGFTYQIVVADMPPGSALSESGNDHPAPSAEVLYHLIETDSTSMEETIDREVEQLYQKVIDLWQPTSQMKHE